MKAGGRRSRRFLCFGVAADAVSDDEEQEASQTSSVTGSGTLEPERRRRRLLRRTLSRILRPLSSPDRSGKLCEDRSRSRTRKVSDASSVEKSVPESCGKSTDDDYRRAAAIFSSSSSASTSSSSSSASLLSSASSYSFPAPEAKHRQKSTPPPPGAELKRSAPGRRNYDPATGLCLLLVSLSVMVFCGRLSAILWTSTWLCLVPRRNPVAGPPDCDEPVAAADLPELRRRGCEECEKKRVVLEGLLERNRRV